MWSNTAVNELKNAGYPYIVYVYGGNPEFARTLKEARDVAYQLAEIHGRKATIFTATEECVVNAVTYKPIKVAA